MAVFRSSDDGRVREDCCGRFCSGVRTFAEMCCRRSHWSITLSAPLARTDFISVRQTHDKLNDMLI